MSASTPSRDASIRPRAVVFAYHSVGVRCLKVLLAAGIDVALVVTHEDSAGETIWFDSVANTARDAGLEVAMPSNPNEPGFVARLQALKPDFVFSFYYRQMLGQPILDLPKRGALNMHGSLLPAYRGRVPINWAVLHGETRTGASLHYMVAKPDAGDLVAQTEVPILPDDTAGEVFGKVVVAAEQTLWRVLPALIAGNAPRVVLDLTRGSYFGGRRPEDGRIDWTMDARRIHDLVRAVAPPYPGAWSDVGTPDAGTHRVEILETRVLDVDARACAFTDPADWASGLRLDEQQRLTLTCRDGATLWLRRLRLDGQPVEPARLPRLLAN